MPDEKTATEASCEQQAVPELERESGAEQQAETEHERNVRLGLLAFRFAPGDEAIHISHEGFAPAPKTEEER